MSIQSHVPVISVYFKLFGLDEMHTNVINRGNASVYYQICAYLVCGHLTINIRMGVRISEIT